jgi:hypothetical protein
MKRIYPYRCIDSDRSRAAEFAGRPPQWCREGQRRRWRSRAQGEVACVGHASGVVRRTLEATAGCYRGRRPWGRWGNLRRRKCENRRRLMPSASSSYRPPQ